MQTWEYVVVCVGVAFVALIVYLIVVLKNANKALTKINEMLTGNSDNLNIIITNVEGISRNVNDMCSQAKGVVDKVGDTVSSCMSNAQSGTFSVKEGNALSDSKSLKTAIGIVSFAISGLKVLSQFKENNRTKKLLKELKKQNKK